MIADTRRCERETVALWDKGYKLRVEEIQSQRDEWTCHQGPEDWHQGRSSRKPREERENQSAGLRKVLMKTSGFNPSAIKSYQKSIKQWWVPPIWMFSIQETGRPDERSLWSPGSSDMEWEATSQSVCWIYEKKKGSRMLCDTLNSICWSLPTWHMCLKFTEH